MKTRLIIHIILVLCSGFMAQNVSAQQEKKTLSEQEFISIVKSFHPVAKQASLVVEAANANLLSARGAFDPYVNINSSQKTFDGSNYYNYVNPELKIPTWYGIEVVSGMENNSGSRTDESVTLGKSSYAGVNISLLNGLVIDRRRADLKQAKIFRNQSEQEKRNIINDLLYDAYSAYWNWVKEYQSYLIISDAVQNNIQRYDFVRNSAVLGERAFVDTTEALAQLQNLQYMQSESLMKFMNAGYQLSNFMWLNNETAFDLTADIIPDSSFKFLSVSTIELPVLNNFLDAALTNHPKLRIYDYKLDILDVEKQYKFQQLLPKFDVKYNVLSKQYFEFPKWGSQYLDNNYRFGFKLAMPLFLREGRGEYKLAKIKIRDTRYDQQQTRLEIQNKIKTTYNEMLGFRQQVLIKQAAYENYLRMLQAETERFKEGESSLFLVNSRENKLIEEAQKLAELRTKFFKSIQSLQWAAGQLR